MPRKAKIRGTLKADDYNRAIITDTSPFEVPLVFSNDGFYKNLMIRDKFSEHFKLLLSKVLESEKYTIPYRYNIVKDSISSRQLSLLHPSTQRDVCDFYREYEELICYYCGLSDFTIRAPERVGSTFHFASPISDKNKYKNQTVDLSEIDKLVKNPASFFAYRGYDRLYKFFNSSDLLRIEKKYYFMMSLDVSKCFASIYTHSIAWALKDIHTAKQNIGSNQFGSHFDSLMQRMNYNETNGICIGAEISRIFAEIILGKVDRNVCSRLAGRDMTDKRDYEVKRYVDNYYIFANSEAALESVRSAIASCLLEFKLHLNEFKTELLKRPFYTKKSKVVDETNIVIQNFSDRLIGYNFHDGRKFSYPLKVFRYEALYKSVLREVKSSCYTTSAGYEDIANYAISAFGNRLTTLIDDWDLAVASSACTEDDYVNASMMLLELCFYFYGMNPTVASSLSLSKSIIVSARFFKKEYPERLPFFQERIVRWTAQLLRDPRFMIISKNCDAVPIEILNILIAMHDIAADHTFSEDMFRKIFFDFDALNYFSLVSCMFIIRDNPKFDSIRRDVVGRINVIIEKSLGLAFSSHDIHLLLDTLSCPFVSKADRISLYKHAAKSLGFAAVTNLQADKAVDDCEAHPWFVSWSGVELLNLITKKELSTVY